MVEDMDYKAEYFEELEEMQRIKLEEIFQGKEEEKNGSTRKNNVE